MKKILIFYGSYGGGHLSAANSIKEHLNETKPEIEVKLIDCVQYVNKAVNKLSTKAYNEMAKKAPWAWGKIYSSSQKGALAHFTTNSNKLMALKLKKLIKTEEPDLIISTHPFSTQMCAFLKKRNAIHVKLATVLTDYAPHDQWLVFSNYCEYYFVAHDEMKTYLIKKGIDSNKIFATGIPLSNRFLINYNKEEILNNLGLKPNKTTILFFGGGKFGLGKGNTDKILRALAENFSDIQVIAISGKNEKMKKEFNNIVLETDSQDNIKVLEYTNIVPQLMRISDLVITKPGGLTVTESLASGLPIIIINPIPGQEEENAEYLEKAQVGIWLKKEDNLQEVLAQLIENKINLKNMKIRARLLAKKNSTKDICKILLDN